MWWPHLKSCFPKSVPQPWLNEVTHVVRQEGRKAERRWKKNKWQVSFERMKDLWKDYQSPVKAEKNKYISNIISTAWHIPCVLLKSLVLFIMFPRQPVWKPLLLSVKKFSSFLWIKILTLEHCSYLLYMTHPAMFVALLFLVTVSLCNFYF